MGTYHGAFTDPNNHESKGASTATIGQIAIAQGDGTVPFKSLSGGATIDENGVVTVTGAGTAENIEITNDDATNATMYPVWVTANTGNLPAKVSSTKISFNPSTGILTSTGFAGPLTGNVTGNLTGNADTVTNLSLAAAVTFSGAYAATFTFTGVTALTFPTSGTLATQAYADALVVAILKDQGNYDASGNVFPSASDTNPVVATIKKGFLWSISVPGTLGGHAVTAGDVIRALIDAPGQTDANWAITENNFGYVAENTANKSTDVNADQASNTKYSTVKSIYDWAVGLFAPIITAANFGSFINGLTGKTTPVDADYIPLMDSADSNNLKKLSWANTKATLKTYFDGIYVNIASFIAGYSTTATAAGTTTLTSSSNYQQFFTGSTTQICQLPVTSTLALGQGYKIVNNSTGVVTVKSSGSNDIVALPGGTACIVTCILTSGTTAASWSYDFIDTAASKSQTLTSSSGNIAWDLSQGQKCDHTATENTNLNNPTGLIHNMEIVFKWKQNASAAKTLAFGSKFLFFGPSTVSATLSSTQTFVGIYDSSLDKILMTMLGPYS